jgi:hypothetical protein
LLSAYIKVARWLLFYCTNEDVHCKHDMIDGVASELVNDRCQALQNRPCKDPLTWSHFAKKGRDEELQRAPKVKWRYK